MSEFTSFPWDNKSAEELDRNVSSDLLAESYFHKLNNGKNGLFSPVGTNGQVIVSADTSSVTIQPAAGAIKGRIFSSTAPETIVLPYADNDLPRYDLIVIRWSRLAREVTSGFIKGVAASSPQYPELTRNSDVYEVCLASVLRAPGDNTIDAAEIRDERLNANLIELIPVIGTIDTTDMDAQLKGLIEKYNTVINEALDETIAGSLQLKTEENADAIKANKDAISTNAEAIAVNKEVLAASTNIKSVSLESLGFNINSPISEICAAMPNNTSVDYAVNEIASGSEYIFPYSIIQIVKINSNRVSITSISDTGAATAYCFASYRSDTGLSRWSLVEKNREYKITSTSIALQDALNLLEQTRGVFVVTAYADPQNHATLIVSWNVSMFNKSVPLILSKAEYGVTVAATNALGTIAFSKNASITAKLLWSVN